MPGLLRSDATCPRCGDPLDAIVDETNRDGVTRKYYHGKRNLRVRRMLPCKVRFSDHDEAADERKALEVTSVADAASAEF
jgi:predicted transcriptional regulator